MIGKTNHSAMVRKRRENQTLVNFSDIKCAIPFLNPHDSRSKNTAYDLCAVFFSPSPAKICAYVYGPHSLGPLHLHPTWPIHSLRESGVAEATPQLGNVYDNIDACPPFWITNSELQNEILVWFYTSMSYLEF